MASSSSSPLHQSSCLIKLQNKNDVFLSFRGEDTRANFTSHLHEALRQNNIQTFIDDQLNRGDEISKSLLDAIEASSISLIIFSEGYASSGWCLDELLKILECKKLYQQIVIPIFYDVDPSHVRKHSGTFGDLFSKLQGRLDKMQTWRNALTEAANLSGFDSHNFRTESELIKKVVNHIVERLAKVFPCEIKDQLVGVESKVKEIESLLALDTRSKDVFTLGIWGIGGIGKTTIARVVFCKNYSNFEASCFLQNVREESERPGGLARLQRKLISKLLKDENIKTENFDIEFNFRRLSHEKVLIVLDDVTSLNQIESLIGSLDWFKPESLIIITTRNKQVLKNCGVKKIFEVNELEKHHSLELFSRHAFKQNYPNVGYEEQSDKVINYAQGLPLALKVLGCSLFEKEKEVWESAIKKLQKCVDRNIQEVLKMSYDGLDDYEKNIFLDIACFFKGAELDPVMKFLDASGFYPEKGISDLVDKSLLIISHDNLIIMHDLLQEMGREIVRKESVNDPGKRSRLWHHEDIFKVLKFNMGTEAIEGIYLNMSKVKEIRLNPDTFTKMHKLRFLKFYSSWIGKNKCKIPYFQGPGLADVKYFYWHGYPLKSLPSNIHLEKLVSLEMPNSHIERLRDGVQHHGNSNQIILAACKKLFTKIPNPSLTQYPKKLVTLNLRFCKSLKSIPAIIPSECLKNLDLSYCSKLKTFPEISSTIIETIRFSGTAIKELPSSIGCLSRLSELFLDNCSSLKSLPSSLCNLKSLERLYLYNCSNLQRLPDEIGNLEALELLLASGTGIREIPSSIGRLNYLEHVDFGRCRGLVLPVSFCSDGLRRVTILRIFDCGITVLPQNLAQFSSLEFLDLRGNNFERIPESIIQLSKLLGLYLDYCQRLQFLPKLPCNLDWLSADHCTALESLSTLFSSYEYPLYRCGNNFISGKVENRRISMRNNFKLDQNNLRRILEDDLHYFELMATACWKDSLEEINYPEYQRDVYLPGNEIPKWFRFRGMGSYISLNMPPGFFNNKTLIGFALSVIVNFRHHVSKSEFDVFCEYSFDTKECDRLVVENYVGDMYYVESDHLFLGYNFFSSGQVDQFRKHSCVLNTLKIQIKKYGDPNPSERCPIQKWGIHFFYAPDCMQEEELHHIRLKYSG